MARITQPKDHEPIRVVETKSGPRYRVVIDIAAKGQPRRQLTTTHATLKAARRHVMETRAALARGSYTAPTAESLDGLADRWLASRRDIRPVTREGYENALKPVRRKLGNRAVQSLTVADIDTLVSWLSREGSRTGEPLAARSVRASMIALGQVLDLAMREDKLTRNVARLARRPRVRQARGADLEHWQPDQLRAFVAVADGHEWAAAWRLSASGLTRSDVLGLRWSDVNLAAGTATIHQGRVALDHGDHTDDPKSQARRRTIPVEAAWPGTVALLKALRTQQAADRLAAGTAWTETGFVVVDAIGRPVAPQVFSDHFRRLSAKAGLPPIRLHGLRHSLAFTMHAAGVTPADAAAMLGHSVEVHLAVYLPESGSSGIASAAHALGRSVTG